MEQTAQQQQKIARFLSDLERKSREELKTFRAVLTFKEPVFLTKAFSRNSKKEFIVRFFISTNGVLCFAPNRKNIRTGYAVRGTFDSMRINQLVDIKEHTSKSVELSQEERDKKEAQKVLNRLHPNIWSNFKKELQGFIEGTEARPYFLENNGKAVFRNIKSLFSEYEIKRIKEAMDEGGEYSCSLSGTGGSSSSRDRRVQVKKCEDGVIRAWFSSEYYGCGNGDYYLLINPTTALYIERD